MLRTDRLMMLSSKLIELVETIPADRLAAELPAGLPIPRFLAGRAIAFLRTMALDSLRRLPDRAAQSPANSDAVLQHAIAIVAWLDGQTDTTPPVLEYAPAITSRSSDGPTPGKRLS